MSFELARDLLAAALIVVGALVVFSAALGLLRFPDVYTRMHAATTAGVVGSGAMLLGAGIAVGTWNALIVAALGVFFLLATVTIAAHTLGRAAYLSGAPLTDKTIVDALQDVYERHDFDRPAEQAGDDPTARRPAQARQE